MCKILTKQNLPVVKIPDLIKTYREFSLKTETLACAQNAVGRPRTEVFMKFVLNSVVYGYVNI